MPLTRSPLTGRCFACRLRRMNDEIARARGRSERSGLFRLQLALEFMAIYVGGPLAILALHCTGILFVALWLGALIALAGTRKRASLPWPALWHEVRGIALRFLVLAPLITVATWLVFPNLFLGLPRKRPLFWAMIMVLYPLLSV